MNAGIDLIAPLRKFVVEMTRLTGRTADEPVLRGQLRLGPRRQRTPIHDHTVWGLVGVLRGVESCVRYTRGRDGRLATDGDEAVMRAGEAAAVSPTIGDIHAVANALDDGTSISIHVYGANIGAVSRHVFDPQTGAIKPFVSGYSSPLVPNLWDRSAATRAALAG